MQQNSNQMYDMVKDFHNKFNLMTSDKPRCLDGQEAIERSSWTAEELVELLYATSGADNHVFKYIYKEFRRRLDQTFENMLNKNEPIDDIMTAQADALTDQLYFVLGSFVHMGIKPFELLNIVHSANIAKLWNIDGEMVPKYREEDGKIVKPPNWERDYAPESRLKEEIEKQRNK